MILRLSTRFDPSCSVLKWGKSAEFKLQTENLLLKLKKQNKAKCQPASWLATFPLLCLSELQKLVLFVPLWRLFTPVIILIRTKGLMQKADSRPLLHQGATKTFTVSRCRNPSSWKSLLRLDTVKPEQFVPQS